MREYLKTKYGCDRVKSNAVNNCDFISINISSIFCLICSAKKYNEIQLK